MILCNNCQNYFKANYIAIAFATGYLFNIDETGATVPMTDSEKAVVAEKTAVARKRNLKICI